MCRDIANWLLALQQRVSVCLGRQAPPEDLDLDPRSRPESDRQIAVGDVAPEREAIRAAAEPADDRPIGIDGLSAVDGEVLLVAHQQGPQTPSDARRPGGQQRVPAVEIALVEAHAEPKSGLQRIVQQGEVGAVVPVTLLHPQRVERSVATWPDIKSSPGVHQAIPDLDRQPRLDIKFPAQLADVGHPLGEDVESGNTDVASLHEGEAVFRNVVIGQATEDGAGLRSPHPDDTQVLRCLADLDRAVLVALLQPQPAEVTVHIPGPRDQPEPLQAESSDGDVTRDPAAAVEQLRIDDAADRPVDLVPGNPLEQRERAWAGELDLPEGCHVDHPHAFAKGAMLRGLQREPWWPVPPETALVRARTPPGPARLEVLGPFPAVFASKDAAQVLDPVVEGTRAARPAPLVGVVGIAEKVVIAVGLFRQLSDVAMVAVDRPEAPGAIGIEIELALAGGDKLRDRFPPPARGAEPVQRQPGR